MCPLKKMTADKILCFIGRGYFALLKETGAQISFNLLSLLKKIRSGGQMSV